MSAHRFEFVSGTPLPAVQGHTQCHAIARALLNCSLTLCCCPPFGLAVCGRVRVRVVVGRGYWLGNPNYFMCWGGGHDHCMNSGGNQWNNLGHDYRPSVGGGYGSSTWKNWMTGQYNHNARNERDLYEVYIIKS